MTLLDKLDVLKARTGDNNSTLAKNSGIPYTTIDGLYKKGYTNMKLSTLQQLAEYFEVSIDYLAKDDCDEEKPATDVASERAEFSKLFTSLSYENRMLILGVMKAIVAGQERTSSPQE